MAEPANVTAIPTALKLIAASQPDMVRATQKDEAYVEQYVEATREVMRRIVGPFRTLQYAREAKLLALLLYHGLSTGVGNSTLGEEYCGMLQVTAQGRQPSIPRRMLLTVLLSAGPYAAERLAGQLESAAEEGEGEDAGAGGAAGTGEEGGVEAGVHPAEMCGYGEEAERRGSGAGAGAGPGLMRSNEVSTAAAPVSGVGGGGGGGMRSAVWRQWAGGPGGEGGGVGAWWRLLAAAVTARWARAWRALVRVWPRLRPLLSYMGRLHLALFYIYGTYYSLAHRLAGVRYSLSMRPLQGRPSYRFLGVVLGLQLALVAVMRARGVLRRLRVGGRGAAGSRTRRREGVVLEGEVGEASFDGLEEEEERYAGADEPAVVLEEEVFSGWGPEEEEGEEEGGGRGQREGAQEEEYKGGKEEEGGSGSGGGALDGGWERVEPQDVVWSGAPPSGGSWEADVFGVGRPTTLTTTTLSPWDQQQQEQQQQQQGQQRPSAEGPQPQQVAGKGKVAPGGEAVVAPKGPPAGAEGQRHRAAATWQGVVPLLTSQRQCPLCLSAKSHPTSTPCGHTFCWGCITTWCVEKPECPLCRSAVKLPQLVALYHTNC